MFSNLNDIFKLLKNAGPIGEQMEEVRARITRLRITGEAGAGMVRVTVSGDGRLTDCKIDDKLLTPDDYTMLEDLFISATNDALDKSKEAVAHEMQSVAGLANMPNFQDLFNHKPPGGGS